MMQPHCASFSLSRQGPAFLWVLLAHAGAIGFWHLLPSDALKLAPPPELVILANVVDQPAPMPAPVARAADVVKRPAPSPSAPAFNATQAESRADLAAKGTEPPAQATSGQTHTTQTTSGPASQTAPPAPAETVTLPSSGADYLRNPPPAYPRLSRRMGEQGTVMVRVLILADGHPDKAEIRTSSGYPRLDEAAIASVQGWRFVPGKRNGVAQAMWFNIPIRFVLD